MSALRESTLDVVFVDMLVGLYRHDNRICKPGLYRVVFCEFGACSFIPENADAVCDDFGNLVKVSA